MTLRGYCVPCDDVVETVNDGECRFCGTPTEPIPVNPREKYDDDGSLYADPRDFRDGLE